MLDMENLDWMVSDCWESQVLVQWFLSPVAYFHLQASLLNLQVSSPLPIY